MYPSHVTDSLTRVKNSMPWLDFWGLVLLTELSTFQKSARWNWEMGNAHFLEIISSLQGWILEQTTWIPSPSYTVYQQWEPRQKSELPSAISSWAASWNNDCASLSEGCGGTDKLEQWLCFSLWGLKGDRQATGPGTWVRAQCALVQLLLPRLRGCPVPTEDTELYRLHHHPGESHLLCHVITALLDPPSSQLILLDTLKSDLGTPQFTTFPGPMGADSYFQPRSPPPPLAHREPASKGASLQAQNALPLVLGVAVSISPFVHRYLQIWHFPPLYLKRQPASHSLLVCWSHPQPLSQAEII